MKTSRKNPYFNLHSLASLLHCTALTLAFSALLSNHTAQAAALTWDTDPADGINAGTGTWNTTAGNTVWNNAGTNVVWSQTNTTTAANTAIFAGDDAAADTYIVTLAGQIATNGLTFNTAGYKLDGTVGLYLPTNSIIETATGKAATIACTLVGDNKVNNWLARQDSIVHITGITTGVQQPMFVGETGEGTTGTFNFSGTHTFSVCTFNALVNVTGVSLSSSTSFMIGRGNRTVNGVTSSTGTLTLDGVDTILNHNGGGTGNNTMIGRDGGTGALVIKNGTFNTATGGNTHDIALPQDNNVNSRGTLDVQGGTINVGSLSNTSAKINFGRVGLASSQTATMTQSGGTVNCHGGILFGGATAGNFSGTATWNMTGGILYLGAGGISEGALSPTEVITLSGGTIGALANWTGSLPMTLGTLNGDVTFQSADAGGNPFDIAISKPLTGEGGMKKTGRGKLTLSDVNNYSGTTLVRDGTLQIVTGASPSTNGPLILDASEGSPVALVQVTNAGQHWEIGTLTCTGGTAKAEIQYGALAPSSTIAPIKITGDVGFNTLPEVAVNGTAIAVGTYPLMQYSGTFSGTSPVTVTLPAYCSGILSHNPTTKTISLVVNQSSYVPALSWAAGDGAWNINETFNWKQLGSAVRYNDGNAVTFDDTASGSSPIAIAVSTIVSPYGITVNATKDYILTGPGSISGTGSVNLLGAGVFTLNGSNAYTGGTILSAGQLNIDNGGDASSSAIGTGPLTINTGTAIDNTSGSDVALLAANSQTWNGNFSYVGSANNLNLGTGAVTLANNISVNVAANTLTVGGTISGDYKLTKTGDGILTLTAANSFSGGLTLVAGGLHVANMASIGIGALTLAGGTIDNISGGELNLSASSILLGSSFTFAGSNNLTLEGVANLLTPNTPSAIVVSDKTLTLTGAVTLANSVVTKSGIGTLTYSGNLANTGGMIVHEGRVNLDKSSGTVITNGEGVRVNTTGLLVITGDGGDQIADGSASMTPVRLTGGTFDLSGRSEKVDSLTISGGGVLSNSAATSTSTLTLKTGSAITISDISGFEVTAADGILDLPGPIVGNGTLRKTGAGTLAISGTSTYSGPTLVEVGNLAVTGSLGASAVTVSDAAALSGDGNLGGDVTILSGAHHALTVAASADTQITRVITGALTLDPGNILDLTTATTPTAGIYVLASAATITGTPTTINYSGPGTVSVDTASSPNRLLLTVAGGPAGFAGWITGAFAGGATVPAGQQGPNDDPDRDGITNLLEYAIAGQDPTVGNASISTFNAYTLSFAKREGTSGLTYAIVESTDLGLSDAWTEVTGDSYVNSPNAISFRFTPSSLAKNFARLKVSQAP